MSIGKGMAKVLDAYQVFTSSRLRCLVFSLVFMGIVFFVATTAWFQRDINDDYAIALALSGNWGEGDGRCLFINYFLNLAVFALNAAIPAVNWFLAFEYGTAYLAFTAITYLCLTRSSLPACALVLVGNLILMIPGCIWVGNFTFIAAIDAAAGGLALVLSLREERHEPALVAMGLAFLACACLLRIEAFYLCIPFFGIAALAVLFTQNTEEASFGRKLLRLWPFVLAVVLGGFLFAVDYASWQDEPWHDWRSFNNVRSQFSDYPQKDYDEVADVLAEMGVSENDYDMLNNWMTEDPEFFTAERMNQILEVSTINLLEPELVMDSIQAYFENKITDARLMLVLVMALAVIIFTFKGKERWFAFLLMAVAIGISLYFMVLGRLIPRVHLPIWMLALTAACALAYRDDTPWRIGNGAHTKRKGLRVAVSAFCVVCAAVPVLAAAAVVGYSGMHFSADRVAATYTPRTFQPESTMETYYREHPDTVFVASVRAEKAVRFNYRLRGFPPHETIYSELCMGGWTSHAPFMLAQQEAQDMKNVFRGLVDNDSAQLICLWKSEAKMVQTFLKEHYYPNCSMKQIDTIKCDEVGMELYVYKFSK